MSRAALLMLVAACAAPQKPAVQPRPNPEREQRAPQVPPQTPDAPFRAQPPAPGAPVAFHAPIPKQLKLSNGVPVFLIERHEIPLVTVSLTFRSGADTEPPGKAGLSSLVIDLLDEGTATRDATQIARGFEDLAARYGTRADADATGLQVTALADTLAPVLDVFADVALHPAFRDADVERIRVERLGQIAQALDDPQSIGQHVLSRAIFGDKHPWGFPAEGTVKTVKSITRKDLERWHQGYFRPDNAALIVVGDTDEAALMPLLEKSFGSGWKAAKAPPPLQRKVPKAARTIYIVDKPGAPQSQIWIGEVGIASGAPDVFPARVMNDILAGFSLNSRLSANLRSEHGWSYGVFSYFDTHREAGPFVVSAGVISERTADAVAEFVKELNRMKTGEVSDAELADAKDSLVRAIPALFASGEQTAAAYANAWAHDRPIDYYAHYQERIEAVTKADVAKAARERLHPEEMAIVVVGPSESIEPAIEKLKLGRVEIRDANGDAAKAAAAAAGAGK